MQIPPGLRDPLQPGDDIDAIAENIVVVDDDVADVNADPGSDPQRGRPTPPLLTFGLHLGN
jgi:hypothetical protein